MKNTEESHTEKRKIQITNTRIEVMLLFYALPRSRINAAEVHFGMYDATYQTDQLIFDVVAKLALHRTDASSCHFA